MLLAAMGRLQASDLLPNERHYDANAKFERARTRGWEPLQAPISVIDKAGW
jgi:outer membrane protein